jgi:hypothetical protein
MYVVSLQILINICDAIARVFLEHVVAHIANPPVTAILVNMITPRVQTAGRKLAAVSITVIPDVGSTVRMILVQVEDHMQG